MSDAPIAGLIAAADTEFPALFQLFGGYFHEDWRSEYGDPAAAVTAFIDEAPPDAVRAAAAELSRVEELGLGEQELDTLLHEGLGCAYRPESDGLGSAAWLAALRQRLLPGA